MFHFHSSNTFPIFIHPNFGEQIWGYNKFIRLKNIRSRQFLNSLTRLLKGTKVSVLDLKGEKKRFISLNAPAKPENLSRKYTFLERWYPRTRWLVRTAYKDLKMCLITGLVVWVEIILPYVFMPQDTAALHSGHIVGSTVVDQFPKILLTWSFFFFFFFLLRRWCCFLSFFSKSERIKICTRYIHFDSTLHFLCNFWLSLLNGLGFNKTTLNV